MTTEAKHVRLRAGWIAAVVAVVVFGGKLVAWFLTDSAAVLSDAMESVVNIAAAAMLVTTLTVAARPADEDHPYGHGKIEFFSAGIEATLVMLAALIIFFESGRALWLGRGLQAVGPGLIVLGGFGAMNAVLGVYLLRVGKATRSVALEADGRHVLADVWTTAGVIVGLVLVQITGWLALDPLIAMAVGVHILRAGWKLGWDAVNGLMDAADEEVLAEIAAALDRHRSDEWIDVHGLRSWRSGADVHSDLHVVVPRYLDAERLHEIHEEIELAIHDEAGLRSDAVVHFDPCRPPYCPLCRVEECPVREAPFDERAKLTLERARRPDETTGVHAS